jgi:hypothetical protein
VRNTLLQAALFVNVSALNWVQSISKYKIDEATGKVVKIKVAGAAKETTKSNIEVEG